MGYFKYTFSLLGVSNINFERLSKESLEVGRKLLV